VKNSRAALYNGLVARANARGLPVSLQNHCRADFSQRMVLIP